MQGIFWLTPVDTPTQISVSTRKAVSSLVNGFVGVLVILGIAAFVLAGLLAIGTATVVLALSFITVARAIWARHGRPRLLP